MLKNLLESWSILAPDEVTLSKDCTELSLRRNIEEHGIIVIETTEPLLVYEQDALQGYLQRCIEARGWGVDISRTRDDELNWFVEVEINTYNPILEDPAYKVCKHDEVIYLAFLQCYLKALAAQRTITPNTTWKHFKGGVVNVLGKAFWSSGAYLEQDKYVILQGLYSLEEDAFKKVQLFKSEDKLFYLSEYGIDSNERVFYDCNSMGCARKSSDFLDLVGSVHAEDEGKLRFVEGVRSV